jgi:8-oxo-dGTP pyrophosphatase MutT (NUDIX family)
MRHSFIGGRIEPGETPEVAVIRELKEEALVDGEIIFQFSNEVAENHYTFLIDIGTQVCSLGADPEEENLASEQRSLKDLMWIKLDDAHLFTECDKNYIQQLLRECSLRNYRPSWMNKLSQIIHV